MRHLFPDGWSKGQKIFFCVITFVVLVGFLGWVGLLFLGILLAVCAGLYISDLSNLPAEERPGYRPARTDGSTTWKTLYSQLRRLR